MKLRFVIVCLLMVTLAHSQTDEQKLVIVMKNFHQSLVAGNTVSINQQTDKALSYGHSNGWVETKQDMIKNVETGYMKYTSFNEDSVIVTISENVAHVRFVADIDVALNGKPGTYHLRVLEVWMKKGKRWLLFARQAVR